MKCTINPSPFEYASVDVLIPFHGEYHRVKKLMESILQLTSSPKIRVFLIDDCSPNESFIDGWKEYQSTVRAYDPFEGMVEKETRKKIFGIRLNKHLGFGAAIKVGAQASDAPYICILHSDCLIKSPRWLLAMGESLLNMKQQGVKLVSARSNNSGCDVQNLEGDYADKVKDFIVDEPLPLYCALFHRELFNRIGGHIKSYPYAGYEGDELFYRMKKHGYGQGVSGEAWVYHEGESTIKNLWQDPKIKKIMLGNSEKFEKDLKNMGYQL